jgi:hypothetical protein
MGARNDDCVIQKVWEVAACWRVSPLASETLLTFGAVAGNTMIADALPAAEQDPAERSARSIECAQKADAQDLAGQDAEPLFARLQPELMSAKLEVATLV